MVVVKWVLIHSHTSGFRSEEPIFLFFFLCAGSALRGAKWSNKKAPTIQGTGDWFAVPGGVRARLAGPPLGSVEQSALMKDAALFLFFFFWLTQGLGRHRHHRSRSSAQAELFQPAVHFCAAP